MAYKKIIALDTDFISKTYDINDKSGKHLVDEVLKLPYDMFCCHSRIREEISRHCDDGVLQWLDDKIANKEIEEYSDKMILEGLFEYLPSNAMSYYIELLRDSCNIIKSEYFEELYGEVSKLDYDEMSIDTLIGIMVKDEEKAQMDCNLGEIKTFVLIKYLWFIHGIEIGLFCSDDKKARMCAVHLDNVRCISVLSSFIRLHREIGLNIEDAMSYINSYIDNLNMVGQDKFKIQDSKKHEKIYREDCRKVLEGIFNNEYEDLKNGMLRYRK